MIRPHPCSCRRLVWLAGAVAMAVALVWARPAIAAVGVAAMERFDELPYFRDGTACYQFSSHDRSGSNDDGCTYPVLYRWNGKYVVFDAIGPGCIYNIWFTSENLGTKGNIQFYFDGEVSPSIDMPITQFFGGGNPPFVSPLVGSWVAGGYYCYVPIPFAQRLIVCTTGNACPFYHHFTYHRFASADGVQSWTGTENMSTVLNMWNHCGTDPKDTAGNQTLTGTVSVSAGQTVTVAQLSGAGSIASVRFTCTAAALSGARIKMYWDGEAQPSVSAPFRDFFGSGLGSANVSSLPLGQTTAGQFYCFFPMPYWSAARIQVENTGASTITGLSYTIQYKTTAYDRDAGYFHTQYRTEYPTTAGRDYTILSTNGRGHYVGVVHSIAGQGGGQGHLEGDERIYVDGSLTPSLYGTGTEDYYLCGYYFWGGQTFSRPSHGWPAHYVDSVDHTATYRFHLSDCIPYESSLLVGIEHGNLNEVGGNYSSVAYYYEVDAPGIDQTDTIDVGNAASESAHGYVISGQNWSGSRTYYYEGDDDDVSITDNGRAFTGYSEFTAAINPDNGGVRLRRRADYSIADQRATVYVDGQSVGTWYTAASNLWKMWLDSDFEIPGAYTQGKSSLRIRIQFVSSGNDWNEFYYWVFTHRPLLSATTSPSELLEAGWNLISVPRQPDDPSPTAVFSGIAIDGRLHRYQSGSGYVAYLAGDPFGFGPVEQGSGYWLHLDVPATISYLGQQLGDPEQITLTTAGWHLMGVSAVANVPLSALTVTRQGTSYSFAGAVDQGWINHRLYGYDAIAGSYFTCGDDPWNAASYLEPWRGYWIHANVDGVAIEFP